MIAAGIALTMLFLDGEAGAEVLCLAADIDQARIVFGACQGLCSSSPEIQQAFRPIIYRDSIEYPETGSVLRVLSADEKGIHGRNPSALVLDELHTFTTRKQREFYIGATTAMGARTNPLTVLISSAGWDKTSICYELHQDAAEIRAGLRADPSFLSVLDALPRMLTGRIARCGKRRIRRCAGHGHSYRSNIWETEFLQADAMPARQNAFRVFFLNQWVGQEHRFIDMHTWDARTGHATTLADLDGRTGFIGLDLGAISDFTAAALLVRCRQDPESWDVFVRAYLPEDSRRSAIVTSICIASFIKTAGWR